MNSKGAFCADGKSGAGGARDGWGMRYRCGVLHGQGEDLDRVRMRTVCCSDGKKVNTFRSSRRCAAQGGRAIVTGKNVTPPGKLPVKLRVVFDLVFLVVTVKVFAVPTTKVALLTLVIRGGRVTVRVKFCVAFGATPFEAVNVRV